MAVIKSSRTTSTAQPIDAATNPAALLRIATVQALTGLGRSSIYAKVNDAQSRFPAPIKLGTRCTRWRAGDVTAWLESVK